MSSDMTWRINVKNLATTVRVGIHPHEKEPQRILINAVIEGSYAAHPKSIGECIDYDRIHALAVKEWPKRPHVALLETYAVEMLEYIFKGDDRVDYARVSVCKPDIFREADAVGVEAEWTRKDYERLKK